MFHYLKHSVWIVVAFLLSGCFSMVVSHIENAFEYEKDISKDPRYNQAIGKCYELNRDIFIYTISGNKKLYLDTNPPRLYVIENGKGIERPDPSIPIRGSIKKGSILKIVKITGESNCFNIHTDAVQSVFLEGKDSDGKKIIAEGSSCFCYPYYSIRPKPDMLTEIESK